MEAKRVQSCEQYELEWTLQGAIEERVQKEDWVRHAFLPDPGVPKYLPHFRDLEKDERKTTFLQALCTLLP